MGHVRVLVIGEELAREGIAPIIDVFKRSREPRMDFFVMVARDSQASEVLSVLTPLEQLPSVKLSNSLNRSDRATTSTTTATLDEIVDDIVSIGVDPLLTGIVLDGKVSEGMEHSNVQSVEPKTKLRYLSIAVFHKDKMKGWLDEDETVGLNYINDKVVSNTGFVMGTDDRPIVVEALRTKTERKLKIINGVPNIFIHVKMITNVQEVKSEMDIGTTPVIDFLTNEAQNKLVKLMEDSCKSIISKYNIDAMGFGQLIYNIIQKYGLNLGRSTKKII